MGCDISEKVDAIPAQPPSSSIIANRRFKIPKKVYDYVPNSVRGEGISCAYNLLLISLSPI